MKITTSKTILTIVIALLQTIVNAQVKQSEVESRDTIVFAPTFIAKTIEGKEVNLDLLKGKVVVINMWFTQCAPCIKEMPEFNKLVEKYAKDSVVFIAVNWDSEEDTKSFLKKFQFNFQIIANRSDIIRKKYMGNRLKFPTTYIIDRSGIIRKMFTGSTSFGELDQVIQNLRVKKADSPKLMYKKIG